MKALNKLSFTSLGLSVLALGMQVGAWAAPESVPNRILVKFKNPSQVAANANLFLNLNALTQASSAARVLGHLQAVQSFSHGLSVVRFASSLTPSEAARQLAADPRVEYAQPDYLIHLFPDRGESSSFVDSAFKLLQLASEEKLLAADPNPIDAPTLPNPPVADPELSQAWGLHKIEAVEAWKIQSGSSKIIVADIDTGIDYTHPDLVNNLWHNPNPTNGDTIGYDFANKDPLPFDDQSHGSHTAGTIGATGGNGIGVSGVSPHVSIMGLKFITAAGSGTTSDAVAAIDYAISHGARVMSNSWGGASEGGDEDRALVDAVARAEAANILFVAAAGNDGTDNDTTPMYPAAIRKANVLTVASSTNRDTKSFFSNFGKETVHVAAPGSNVYSTLPGRKYGMMSGTSMACPHVAGLAALILSERPDLTAVQVKEIIMSSVDPLEAFNGKIVTGGRVNARAAVLKARYY